MLQYTAFKDNKEGDDTMAIPDLVQKEGMLNTESRKEGEVLFFNKDRIIQTLVSFGMKEDPTTPFVYYVPCAPFFDCGKGTEFPMRALYAIVILGRYMGGMSYWVDYESEAVHLPSVDEDGFCRCFISDPLAADIDVAIRAHNL